MKAKKRLTAAQAMALIEEVRKSASAGVRAQDSGEVGMGTIEALERHIGKNWARTEVDVS